MGLPQSTTMIMMLRISWLRESIITQRSMSTVVFLRTYPRIKCTNDNGTIEVDPHSISASIPQATWEWWSTRTSTQVATWIFKLSMRRGQKNTTPICGTLSMWDICKSWTATRIILSCTNALKLPLTQTSTKSLMIRRPGREVIWTQLTSPRDQLSNLQAQMRLWKKRQCISKTWRSFGNQRLRT